ncbi:uncharacterized protein E0L32_003604 [Thyridium curvatum]|uniref:Large ribosomal subunit protein mL59 domain-containing protein n=1 Tax=Thyridium curvatum TaxID=1093900 RepID=A0A507BAU8_9PEZI|nr:uncharacterized protein E0L32_003604 [Thyridium curvatum]TPX16663.1 hypothetical protein E0L32_003604 [Thyridium curvatum]
MAATSSSAHFIQLAKALPPRLQQFLARYPPATILPASSAAAEEGATPSNPRVTGYQQDRPNPFLPMRHPVTGKWHDPVYSLRRQAELVKLAREHGVEELLPPTPKGTEERLRRRVEFGLRVKGTGVGQQVKGHAHERQMVAKYVSPQGGGEQTPAGYLYERNEANDWTFAQDGEEERSHAQHAEAHQGMEAGWKEELDQIPQSIHLGLGKASTSQEHNMACYVTLQFANSVMVDGDLGPPRSPGS